MGITKRLHKNDFEHLVTVLPLSMVNGLVYPWVTMGLLSTYFIGRKLYTHGYQEAEGAFNQYRMAGSVAVNVVHLLTNVVTFYLGYRLATGKLCLQKALSILPK